MPDPRDSKLDLISSAGANPAPMSDASVTSRPSISIHFRCGGVYTRIYRTADGSAYRGRCPKCALPVNFKVGEGGTDSRFFIVE